MSEPVAKRIVKLTVTDQDGVVLDTATLELPADCKLLDVREYRPPGDGRTYNYTELWLGSVQPSLEEKKAWYRVVQRRGGRETP